MNLKNFFPFAALMLLAVQCKPAMQQENDEYAEGTPIPVDRAWSIDGRSTDKVVPSEGSATYTTAIELAQPTAADDWMLDLGEVRDEAVVYINGEKAGSVAKAPYTLRIGRMLKPGINLLDVAVTASGTSEAGLCSEVNLIPLYKPIPTEDGVIAQARLVNGYFMRKFPDPSKLVPFPSRHRSYEGNIWTRGVYYEGLMALHGVDPKQEYLDYTMKWGDLFGWNMRNGQPLTRNADNYCCAQAYIDMYRIYGEEKMIANVTTCFDNILSTEESEGDWTWIDAIQMGMPGLVKYGVTAGRPEFFEKAWQMYNWTRERFWNPEDGLWWRDAAFCPPYTTPNGKQCYWSRGNGWVFANYVRVLEELPSDNPHREVLEDDFLAMAKALAACQRSDGTWNCSLADPDDFGGPEATGTSLFIYGLAWGVRTGRLSEKDYLPAVVRGWNGLNRICIHDNGFIGYSQGSGKEPKEAQPLSYERIPDFEDFGTGCFLLAASEMAKLVK